MADFKRISVAQTVQMIADNNALICDIRDPDSYHAGHIADSIHLTDSDLFELVNQGDFERTIVVVCYHGNSSQGRAQYLGQHGFKDVYSMNGGFEQWAIEQPWVKS